MTLEERPDEAIARRQAAGQFSHEWFVAKAEVERISDALYLQEQKRNRLPIVTAEQLEVMGWALSEEYDDE